jgi:hypothetical protein
LPARHRSPSFSSRMELPERGGKSRDPPEKPFGWVLRKGGSTRRSSGIPLTRWTRFGSTGP